VAGRAGAVVLMAGPNMTEWIEWEGYGPIWQPGFTAWKSGRITEANAALVLTDGEAAPLSQWTADDVRSYVDAHEGDLRGFSDLSASYVLQTVEVATELGGNLVKRTEVTTTFPCVAWQNPQAAAEAEAQAFAEWDEVG
jgi:hypothetical protein